MAFAREDIERVRDATDIVELISSVTTVKRQGRAVKAICPFHQEKTPSLSIDPAQGLYHCFGCGAGGDVFKFVQETQGLDFTDAVELLAAQAGITLTRDPKAGARRDRRQALVELTSQAVDFYRERLMEGPDAGTARAYLRSRGYDARVVERFGLGYSPDEWDALVRHLKRKGAKEGLLVEAGLALRSSRGRLIDRFRGRIMFPIYDLRGDPVGFGARILEGDGPKYLNSPETRIYHKSRLLYGLNWAKAEITRRRMALVVEGYTDVIALHEAGLPIAVATCGTALGEEHFDLLRRFTDRIVLAFDADAAGAGAAIRGDELTLPTELGLDVRVAVMPEGVDPADLVQQERIAELEAAIENSVPLLQFRLDRELDRFDADEPEARARAVRAVAPLVARLSDAVARNEYARYVSRRTGVDLGVVETAIESEARRGGPAPRGRDEERPAPARRLTGPERAERELLRVIAANPKDLPRERIRPELFTRPEHLRIFTALWEAVSTLPPGEAPDIGSVVLTGDHAGRDTALLRRLVLDDRPLPDTVEIVRRVEAKALEREIAELRRELERTNAEREPETYSERFRRLIDLERRKRDLGA